MGTFVGFFGDLQIPEDRRPEFAERMLKLFTQGGMMTLDQVNVMDVKIELMSLPRIDEKKRIIGLYNYFEDNWWEGTGIDTEKGDIWSNKIGWREFNWVTQAAYVLAEFYSDSCMITAVNGDVINAAECIGWLNHLFGEEYTNSRIKDPWKIYKLLHKDVRHQDLLRLAREPDIKRLSQMGTLTYLCVARLEELEAEAAKLDNSVKGPIHCALEARRYIQNRKESSEDLEADLADIKQLIMSKSSKDAELRSDEDRRFVMYTLCIPWEIGLYFVAETFALDFWQLLNEWEPLMANRTPIFEVEGDPFPPVPPVKTSAFLNCSDDDRAFWWTPDGDVTFSAEMEQWMAALCEELHEILAAEGDLIAPGDFFMTCLRTLEESNRSYRRIYAFSTMFQEFVGNSGRREYQAAIILLQRLLQRYDEEIQPLQKAYWPSEFDLPGRKRIKQYLAILANTQLRQRVFGF